jgi:hypothetical protein
MSTKEAGPAEGFTVVQESDVVASRKVSVILLVTIVISIVSVAAAGMILSVRRKSLSFHEPASASAAPSQIANIHQTPILRDRHGWELREKQRRALDEYHIIDRQRGLVQIPIDRAMQIVVDDAARGASGGTR